MKKQEIKELELKILKEIEKKEYDYFFNFVNDILKYINKLENKYEEIFGIYKLSSEFKKICFFEYEDIKENYEIIEKDKDIEYLKDAIFNTINNFISGKKREEKRIKKLDKKIKEKLKEDELKEAKEIEKTNELFFDKIELLGWGLDSVDKEDILTGDLKELDGKKGTLKIEVYISKRKIEEIDYTPYVETVTYGLGNIKHSN